MKRGIAVGAVLSALLTAAGCGGPPLLEAERRGERAAVPLELKLVRITSAGLVPAEVRLRGGGGGVAFLNDTRDALVAVRVPGRGAAGLRCLFTTCFAGSPDGGALTKDPLLPGQVATLCLHEAGAIGFEVVGAGPAALRGRLDVEQAP